MKTVTINDMHFFSEIFLYNYMKLLASSLLQIVYPEVTYQRVNNAKDIKVDFTNFDLFPGTIFRIYSFMKWYLETDPSINSSKFLDLWNVLFLTICVCHFVIFRKNSLYIGGARKAYLYPENILFIEDNALKKCTTTFELKKIFRKIF